MLRLRGGVRYISSCRVRAAALPSTPEMKSSNSWANKQSPNITKDVVGIARQIQETTQPPLDISSQFTRRFTFGDSYDPFDFSQNKFDMEKSSYKKKTQMVSDPFERTGIDPQTLYTMPEILSRFLTSTGQILPRSLTGCSAKNQKKLSNAIKTARACGLLSVVHKHSKYLPTRNL